MATAAAGWEEATEEPRQEATAAATAATGWGAATAAAGSEEVTEESR